jgi:hypothetical protein
MKKIIITTLIIVLSIFFIGTMGMLESTYTRDVVVTKVDCIEVTVQDKQGHHWSFYGDDYTVGQEITVVMNDNHTSIITDDRIVDVK